MTTKTKGANTNTRGKGSTRKTAGSTRTPPASASASVPRGAQKAGSRKTSATSKSARQTETSRALAATSSQLKSKASKSAAAKKSAAKSATKTTAKPVSKGAKSKSGRAVKVSAPKGRDIAQEIAMTSVAPEIAEAMLHEMGHGEDEIVEREAAREARERDILGRLAVAMNRHDDMPNQDLAANIVFHLDEDAVSILVGAIERGDDVHAPDAARVLCEVGSRDHELLLPMAERLVAICEQGNTPMLPFAMYALSPVAPHVAEQLWEMRDTFWQVLSGETGHADMAQAASVKLLSSLCAAGPDYARTLAGGLVDLLGKCLPKDVALYAESVLPALGAAHSHRAKPVLDRRMKELTPAEVARLRRAVRAAQSGQSLYPAAA